MIRIALFTNDHLKDRIKDIYKNTMTDFVMVFLFDNKQPHFQIILEMGFSLFVI